jgi:hypothetical protein
MMSLTARLDDFGKPAWIALTIVSFILCWPLGLLLLGFLIGSGRMGCWANHSGRPWQDRMDRMQQRMQHKMDRMQERMQGRAARWCGPRYAESSRYSESTSGNRAFDEYRSDTLRRLEEEQQEFMNFLDRLRHAKDKAEFDQFMAERRHRSEGPPPQPEI